MPVPDNRGVAQIEPLPTLPIFFKLKDRHALMVGGEAPAAWKTELLRAAGAQVIVVAAEPCDELEALSAADPAGISLVRRHWRPEDVAGVAIAIGAVEADDDARAFRDACRQAGVPVNVIDKPAFCDFQFGTLVTRGPLVVAITTDGAAPVLGQALRRRFEALLAPGLRDWALAAKDWREMIQPRNWPFRQRRRFWDRFADLALGPEAAPPDATALDLCLAAAESEGREPGSRLTLVGCGPGAVDDLTFAAARALQNADAVLYDGDVPSDTVGLARREARRIALPDDARAAQAVVHQECEKGGRLVWLGTGDPTRCPHWRHREEACRGLSGVTVVRGLASCPRCRNGCLGAI